MPVSKNVLAVKYWEKLVLHIQFKNEEQREKIALSLTENAPSKFFMQIWGFFEKNNRTKQV